jgi:hypothetical protein
MTSTSYRDVCPTSYDYPIDVVGQISFDIFGKVYLGNSIAQAIGYAIHKGVKVLKLYGCDFTYPDRNFAEAGRACVEAWCTAAITKYDMDIALCPRTSLFDTVSSSTGVYGFAEQPEVKVGKGRKYKFIKREDVPVATPYKPEDSSGVKNVSISGNVPRTRGSKAGNGRGNAPGAVAAGSDAPAAAPRHRKGVGNQGGTRRHQTRHPAGLNCSGKGRGIQAPA